MPGAAGDRDAGPDVSAGPTLRTERLRPWRPQDLEPFAAKSNIRSGAVMERLGMHTDPKHGFGHERLGPDQPLYRLRREEWQPA